MAKDFTPHSRRHPSPTGTAERSAPRTEQASIPARPAPPFPAQHGARREPLDREPEIVAALKDPAFAQEIGQTLKDRNESNPNAEEFIAHALRQVQSVEHEAHAKLVQCSPASVQAAVKKLAVLGLNPNRELQEGFILPRWNAKLGSQVAIAVPGVRGMERKLMESGKVANIESRAIYLQDHCKVRLGTENVIEHEVNFLPDPDRPNPIVGAYGVVTLKDGRREIAVKRLGQGSTPSPGQGREESQEQGRNGGFMDEETRARYGAQRPAMKGALNKFFKEFQGFKELEEILELDRQSYESAVNPEASQGAAVKVNPQTQHLHIPLAQVGEPETPGKPVVPARPAEGRPKQPAHPVDQMGHDIRQRYRRGAADDDGERGSMRP